MSARFPILNCTEGNAILLRHLPLCFARLTPGVSDGFHHRHTSILATHEFRGFVLSASYHVNYGLSRYTNPNFVCSELHLEKERVKNKYFFLKALQFNNSCDIISWKSRDEGANQDASSQKDKK
jgi:hypothetical protein